MNRTETLLSIMLAPFNRLEQAAQDVRSKRWMSTGEGEQLNVIGRIVNQPRSAQMDEVYLLYLSAKIAANRATGRREELIHISRLVVDDEALQIVVSREGTATVVVTLVGDAVTESVALALVSFLEHAVAIAVRVILRYSNSTPANTFRLDTGPGLDVGHLANGIE